MAKYVVTEYPGFPGPRGFVRPGGRIVLPDDAVPSRSFVPLDEAAHKALTKAKAAYVEDKEKRLAELEPPRKMSAKDRKALLFVPDVPSTKKPEEDEEPGEEDEGQTVRQLAEARGAAEAAPAKGRASDTK